MLAFGRTLIYVVEIEKTYNKNDFLNLFVLNSEWHPIVLVVAQRVNG